MHVLHYERERSFAPVAFARLTDSTRRRISPECFVIRAAVVVTGDTKSRGCPQNQQSRRENEPAGPPARFRSKPTVWRIAKNFRRIKRRNVIAKEIILSLKRSPRGIDDENRQPNKNQEGLSPPYIGAHRLAE